MEISPLSPVFRKLDKLVLNTSNKTFGSLFKKHVALECLNAERISSPVYGETKMLDDTELHNLSSFRIPFDS